MTTITDVTARVARGEVTSQQLTEECLAKIEALNPTLNAFITVTADEALAQARQADQEALVHARIDLARLASVPELCQRLAFETPDHG